MNKVLLLCTIIMLAISNVAMADHIGVFSDASGSSCTLAPGFTSTTAVIHKFSAGATASRFNITFPPGSNFFAFTSAYTVLYFVPPADLSVTYGGCFTGSFVIGTIAAILAPGTVNVVPGDSQTNILYTDCAFVTKTASGGFAVVGGDCPVSMPVEGATWGKVKALYR